MNPALKIIKPGFSIERLLEIQGKGFYNPMNVLFHFDNFRFCGS